MASQLNRVLCAAIAEFQASPDFYAKSYRKYLGVTPPVPFDPCKGGEWPGSIDPASSLEAVLKRGRLRIGHVEAKPYVFRDSDLELAGIDYDTGNALTAIIASHYAGFSPLPEWVPVPGTFDDEKAKFDALYAAMQGAEFDVALSGQANIGSDVGTATIDWLCPTDLCFSNFINTGRRDLPLPPKPTRADVVAALKALKTAVSVAYVANNPGPSSPAAIALMEETKPNVALAPADGSGPLNDWVAQQEVDFAVGDGIASSWLTITDWPRATNYNVQIALDDNPPQQVCGFTLSDKS